MRDPAQSPRTSALLTDLYQLTMLNGYFAEQMEDVAVFEFFVRKLPQKRAFLMAAGLEQVLDYLESLAFTAEELDWLSSTARFPKEFIDYLAGLRFTGDVHAMPEGTVFFPDEPIVRVTAPIPQAQLVESRLINILHLQTLIASKAVRCVLIAPGKLLVDFGMRRSHGAEAALFAARASYLAGFSGTATVLADKLFGIPTFGTMAHSFVQSHDTEVEAFRAFARTQPDNVALLIDTYDTLRGAARIVALYPELKKSGIVIKAVRLDSGDLVGQSHAVRAILDAGQLADVRIFCSSNLDEYALQELLAAGAPIDGFGIGTHLDTSADAPYLDCVYKLQEYAGQARRKRSPTKATWPGRKQVYRYYSDNGRLHHDVLTVSDDFLAGEPLLAPVMRAGRRLEPSPPLDEARQCAAAQLRRLPDHLQQLEPGTPYPVTVSKQLRALADDVDRVFG